MRPQPAAASRERPLGVTIIAIIVLLNGLLTTIGAIIGLIGAEQPAAAIVSLILGILTLVVGAGLLGGSRLSRLLTTIVLVLALAGAIFNMGATGFETWAVVWPILSAVLAIAALVLLYSKSANVYFR